MENMGIGDQAIRSKAFTRSVEQAQKRVEGNNYDIRKNLLQYDDVMNNQREIIYGKRNQILDNESIHEMVLSTFRHHVEDLVKSHMPPENELTQEDYKDIREFVNENLLKNDLEEKEVNGKQPEELIDFICKRVIEEYEDKIKDIPEEVSQEFEKVISKTNNPEKLFYLQSHCFLEIYFSNYIIQQIH